MGMFSTVIHAGNEIQFKTGYDNCDTFKVGDRIDWTPDPYWPGDHIDGVHDGLADISGPTIWVIVKDCIIVAVEPFTGTDDVKLLAEKYGITRPDPKLWTKEQWKARRRREKKAKADYKAWAKVHGDNPIGYYMHCKLNEKSFVDQILPAKKVT